MLVLTRKLGEQITVGDDIILKVVSVEGNRVRVGIEAPQEVRIIRGELVDRQRQQRCTPSPSVTSVATHGG